MDFKPVFIKSELHDECFDSSDIFHHDISENVTELLDSPKFEVKHELDENLKSSDNEESHKNVASVLCKNEPDYSFTSNDNDSACSKIIVDDFANEDNKMNILKTELLNQNENSFDYIKQEEVDIPLNSESSDNDTDSACSKMNVDFSNDDNKVETYVNSILNEQKSKSFACQFCDKSYVHKQSLDNHLVNEHSKEIKTNFKDLITYKIHTCQFCSYQSTHKTQLNRHINSFHNEQKSNNFLCQFCNKCFNTKRSLDNHMLQEHNSKDMKNKIKEFISYKIHSCKICPYQTTYKDKFGTHVSTIHNKQKSKTFVCQFCDKSFVTKRSLDNHMVKEHLNELNTDVKRLITTKIHSCQFCSYKSTYKSHMDTHVDSIHNDQRTKKFVCQFCENILVSKVSLDNHQLKHHKDEMKNNIEDFISSKIYICKSCPYQTAVKSSLDRHVIRIHNE